MAALDTHFTHLYNTVASHPTLPLFKIGRVVDSSGRITWDDVTFEQFVHDVEALSRHWAHELEKRDCKKGSAVGCW